MAGMLIAIGGLVTLLAIVALLLVRRSERVPGTSACRRCGFDLGPLLNDARIATTFACPECGRSTSGFKDTRNRIAPNRPLRALTALALSLGLLATLSGLGMKALSGNQNQWKPIWLLRIDLFDGTPKAQTAAADELATRFASGSVPKPTFDAIFDAIIKRQADPNGPWNRSWADLVQSADRAGLATPIQLASFARFGTTFKLTTRSRIRVGDRVPLRIENVSNRTLEGPTSIGLRRKAKYVQTTLNDDVCMDHGFSSDGSPWGLGTGALTFKGPEPTTPGSVRVTGKMLIEISAKGSTTPLLAWEESLRCETHCVPENEPLIEVIRDEVAVASMRPAIRLTKLARQQPNDPTVLVELEWEAIKVNFAADMILFCFQDDGTEHRKHIGTILIPAGSKSGLGQFVDLPLSFPCKTVDFILRPSVEVAAGSIDLDSVWIGPDLVYPDITIGNQK